MRIRSFAGDLSGDQYRLDVDAQFDDFSTQPSGGGETVSGDGNVRLIVDSMSLPLLTGSASGSAFTLGWSGQARTLRDFASEFAYDGSAVPGTFTQEHRGTLSSPRFSGRVDYETLDMFQGAGEDPPFAGSLLITGRDEATILVTLLDDAGLQLDIDFDGDGTPDETRNTTWATVGQ
jgi:hypothetical protein